MQMRGRELRRSSTHISILIRELLGFLTSVSVSWYSYSHSVSSSCSAGCFELGFISTRLYQTADVGITDIGNDWSRETVGSWVWTFS